MSDRMQAIPGQLHREVAVALAVADAIDSFTLPRFDARDFKVDWKDNQTEVSEIDREAELMIIEALRARFPDDDAFGEEHGLAGNGRASH